MVGRLTFSTLILVQCPYQNTDGGEVREVAQDAKWVESHDGAQG